MADIANGVIDLSMFSIILFSSNSSSEIITLRIMRLIGALGCLVVFYAM